MAKSKKQYVLAWAMAGLLVPIFLYVMSHIFPPEWDKITSARQTVSDLAPLLYPVIYLESILSLFVMDAGLDSGAAGHVVAVIVFSTCWLLNAGLYALIGLISWRVGAPLLARLKEHPG
jgi:hypothetical protein